MHKHIQAITNNNAIGALIEIEVGTEMAATHDAFTSLAQYLALQVAVTNPGDVDELLGMAFIGYPQERLTVAEYIAETANNLGEPIRVARFVRMSVEDLLG